MAKQTIEDLQKLAQEKLAQAYALIKEAAVHAEDGAFSIESPRDGIYIPKSLADRELAKARIKEDFEAAGRLKGLDEGAIDDLLESEVEALYEELPWDWKDYDGSAGWWAPSTC